MLHRLRRHPFPVEAHFKHCLVLTYALPEAAVEPLLPPGLRLDSRHGQGFLAVALVQTKDLRPAGTPRWLGQDLFLSGYRVFTRFRSTAGRDLRGLKILRSDTDRLRMVLLGNLLTHYQYRLCKVQVEAEGDSLAVEVRTPRREADLQVQVDLKAAEGPPAGSPFATLREARAFAGPLPFTFEHEAQTGSMVVIHGRRPYWRPTPVAAEVTRCTFLDRFDDEPVLANAFHVQDIPYRWDRGVVMRPEAQA